MRGQREGDTDRWVKGKIKEDRRKDVRVKKETTQMREREGT